MDVRKVLLSAVLVFSLVAITSPVFAACIQGDMAGTWNAYIGGGNLNGVWWNKCTVTVGSTGTITSGTACFDDDGGKGTVGGGKFTLYPSCESTGSIRLNSASGAWTATVTHATMEQSKKIMGGVGKSSKGDRFFFTLIKK